MKNKIITAALFAALTALAGCEGEGKLTPSPEPEPAKSQYMLPQGDHAYDAAIVAFFEYSRSVVLYDFDMLDFAWNVTDNISWTTTPPGKPEYKPDRLGYELADQANVGPQFELFKSKFADYYPQSLLREDFPQTVLLAGELFRLPEGFTGTPTDGDKTMLNVWFSTYNMIVGAGDALPATPADVNAFAVDLNHAYLAWLRNNGKLTYDERFSGVTNYANSSIKYNENGFLVDDESIMTDSNGDYLVYLREIISKTEVEFAAAYLVRSFDSKGLVKKKYDAILAIFAEHGVDLRAIGNDRE